MPNYIGYVRVGNNAPTFFYDTGFLLQASSNGSPLGWYAYRNVYRFGANLPSDSFSSLYTFNNFKAFWDGLNQQIIRAMIGQHCLRAAGQAQAAGNTLFVQIDTPDVDNPHQASLYQFGGPLVCPGDPGFQAAFDAPHALAALGPLNPNGLPTHHPAVPTTPGLITTIL